MKTAGIVKSIINTGRWSVVMSTGTLLLVLISFIFKYDEQKKFDALQYQLSIGKAELAFIKLSLDNLAVEVKKNKIEADNVERKSKLEFQKIYGIIIKEQKITDERRKNYDKIMNDWLKR